MPLNIEVKSIDWWFWAVTLVFIVLALFGWVPGYYVVMIISAIQVAEGGWPPPPPEKPIAEFEKLLKEDPKLAEAYYQIGYIWDKAKKTDDAKKNYQKALELNPNHHWAKKKLSPVRRFRILTGKHGSSPD